MGKEANMTYMLPFGPTQFIVLASSAECIMVLMFCLLALQKHCMIEGVF